ncbi:X-ray radiation resistance-associated protein 1-like [Watersipora subatra]|uniref:X-ray radiation resistance-associated protein 1-like n=1 Tax=Watersipora subatra TaxID=2589382 RepID=UPI00355B7619
MAATIKFDDGTGSFVNNCFPVRSIIKYVELGEGAWLEAHRAEQRKRFKAVVCAKPPRTYSRLRHERMQGQDHDDEVQQPKGTTLNGFFLMKHCCVEDPTDLCSVNISGLNICEATPEDFLLFDNVAYINAADNSLSLEAFSNFVILRELELAVNGVSSLNLSHRMFPHLEMLDLSYNNLNSDDILQLGYLRSLKVLYLSGNNLTSLPENLAGFYQTAAGSKKRRFPHLEILFLDDNQLNNYTAFAPLAGLKLLKHLNLESNEISAVPQLESKIIKHDAADRETTQKQENADKCDGSQDVEREDADKRGGIKNVEDAKNDRQGQGEHSAQINGAAEKLEAELIEEAAVDFSFGTLELPDMSSLDVSNLTGHDQSVESEDEMEEDTVRAVPFPQLRFLTLAHNYLSEEEDLLPIAAWPNITQVHIYDNPLVNERSGDPPMLRKFLTERLGIDLVRKKPAVIAPPKEFPQPARNRKVSSLVPPVPKCDVEKLIALEYYQAPSTVHNGKSPLPPIEKSAVEQPENTEELEYTPKEQEDQKLKKTAEDERQGETFFMTQVEETAARKAHASVNISQPSSTQKVEQMTSKRNVVEIPAEQQNMFIGYEELLIEDEFEKEIHVPEDLQNTIKALSYALKHPVVNNYTMRLESSQKPFHSYKRSDVRSHKRPQTKAEKISRAMIGVRKMDTVIESPLDRALTDKSITKKYPEAARLLRDIQTKYSNVHSSALGGTENIGAALRRDTRRANTQIVHMVDKDSSVTDLRPNTNL